MATKLLVDSGNLIINRILVDGEFTPDEGYTVHDENGQAIGATYDAGYTPIPAIPNTVLSTPAQTITLPFGDVSVASAALPVAYTWDGNAWVADLAALRAARLVLIQAERDSLWTHYNRIAANSTGIPADGSNNQTILRRNNIWATKLRDVPQVAAPALAALNTTDAIAAYVPDYTWPTSAASITLMRERFFALLMQAGFITAAEAVSPNIPGSISAVFAGAPTATQDSAANTWANFITVSRDDPLIEGVIANGYINPNTGNPLTAAEADALFEAGLA